jgi:hypothetical protein
MAINLREIQIKKDNVRTRLIRKRAALENVIESRLAVADPVDRFGFVLIMNFPSGRGGPRQSRPAAVQS